MEEKIKSVFEISDYSNMGFHFTDSEDKVESIKEKGLLPLIGDNSATFEATPKISFSLGADGLLQTANRFLNLAQTMPMSFFVNDTHKNYLPDSCKEKNMNYVMTTVEALEFMKNYFQNSSYFVFTALATKYQMPIIEERLELSNDAVKNYSDIPSINDDGDIIEIDYDENYKKYNVSVRKPHENEPKQKLYDLIKRIKECLDSYNKLGKNNLSALQQKEFDLLNSAKNRLIIQLMDKTHDFLQLGGVEEEGLFDQIAFHEDKLEWRDQLKRPLNVQSRVTVENGVAIGKGVSPDELYLLTVDGNTRANNIQVLEALYNNNSAEKKAMVGDIDLVGLLIEYSKIPDGELSQYIAMNPEFGNGIMMAQEHARHVIQREREHQEDTTQEQITMPGIRISPDTKAYSQIVGNADLGER